MKDAMEKAATEPGIDQITPKHLANLKEAIKAYRGGVSTLPISENS
jgi:hypothetical protein